ncbi:MAG: SDR family NAD(P)-dependent oxidoreductase [Bryobacteraceae bacterium]|nr:SDR family NAD(P)-dependent oxidoreductase [Bryobacteraceae bacterium]
MPLALITGASAGIGATFARQLAAQGCDLVLVARREDRLQALAAELLAAHGRHCEVLVADLASDADVARVAARIAALPRLDYLVNNAGFGTKGKYFHTDLAGQVNMHRVHVLAIVQLTHAALRRMVETNSGAIINVASVAGFTLSAGGASYSATKHWLNVFTEGLYLELRSSGSAVKVQALCPGFTYSEFHDVMGMDRAVVPKSWWLSADFVVQESLAALPSGRVIVIPGFRYRWLVRLLALVPRPLIYWGAIRAGRRMRRD